MATRRFIGLWQTADPAIVYAQVGASYFKIDHSSGECVTSPAEQDTVRQQLAFCTVPSLVEWWVALAMMEIVDNRTWICSECDKTAEWTAEAHENSGNPICSECDEDMELVDL